LSIKLFQPFHILTNNKTGNGRIT